MAGRLKWHGPKVQAAVANRLRMLLTAAAIVVRNHAAKLISIEGTGVGKGGKLIYGARPSQPGEPPRKQTGRLLGSVAYEVEPNRARIGTNVKYGRILELFMNRPWLRRALNEKTAQVKQIFERGRL